MNEPRVAAFRHPVKFAASVLAVLGLSVGAFAATPVTQMRAADFANTIGVNVHMEYTDGGYANVANVIADLKYLGVTNVRDAALNPSNQGQWAYDTVAAAGFKFDFIFLQNDNLLTTMALTNAFLARHPGSVELIEGANEVNNWPVTYNGVSGTAGAQAFQAATYSLVHSNTATSAVPVSNFTDWPCYNGTSDLGTVHSYPTSGAQPFARFTSDIACQATVMPAGMKMVITEAGYYTLTGSGDNGWGGVNGREQSKLIMNMIMDSAYLGAEKIYLYQLLDAYPDPNNNQMNNHFGLFDINNQPKAVAHSLYAFIHAVQDTGATAKTFTPSYISYSLSGMPQATTKTFELAKSTGVHDIIVWEETPVWNSKTQTDIFRGDYSGVLTLDKVHATVKVYDPQQSPTALATYTNVSVVPVATEGRPIIVEVSAN